MRVPVSWLREHCAVRLSAEDLGDLLTARGLKLERLLRPWEDLGGVRVARVLDVADHPRADRLCVATIDDGTGERQVVAGVRNMGPGDLVPYAPPGATLPGFEGKLERRELRGVSSDGMLCSPRELAISPDHGGILILPDDAEPGDDLKTWLVLDDAVLDIEVPPNRPDLLSVYGVAREAAAATGEDLAPIDTSVDEADEPAGDRADVDVRDAGRCPEYVARVIAGVSLRPSPLHAQVRLTAAGMRPIANLVDATNYVMLEMGQPMHPFDLALLRGDGIVVRRAADAEELTTLDGVERTLTGEDLVIADHDRAVAVAGVIGGGDTEVGDSTSEVLLESARFEPLGVYRTARRLGVRTEASARFQGGVDPEGVRPAAARAAALMAAWSGGRVLSGEVAVGGPPPRRSVAMRPARATAVIGLEVGSADAREALGRLRLPAVEDGDRIVVEVPGHRVDLELEEDLIEEVARMIGYEAVPSSLPGNRQAGGLTTAQRLRRRVADVLSGAGLVETRSMSLVAGTDLERAAAGPALRIANPTSEDDAFLRPALLPGMLRAARQNVAHGRRSIALFEVGRIFAPSADAPVEEPRVAVLLTGPAAEGWPEGRRDRDFFDARGVLEHLLTALGVERWAVGEPLDRPWHPGRSAEVSIDGRGAGSVGEIHPSVAEAFDLPGRVAAFEVALDALVGAAHADVTYRDVSRFPPVHRDVAFLVDREVPAGAIRTALIDAGGDLLDRVILFDVFEGDPLPAGKRSLAFSLDLRAPDRTLTDADADERVRDIAERLRRDFGAELRAG